MTSSYDAGLAGESTAEAYLVSRGMRVLARRFRAEGGEIDLVMEDGETVVFVEVKARPQGKRGDGLIAVTPAKQKRIARAAVAFLYAREWMSRAARFDVVEISAAGIVYLSNAFQTRAWG